MDSSSAGAVGVNIFEKVKLIFTNPKGCWEKLKSEQIDEKSLYVPYAAALLGASTLCSFLGLQVFGISNPITGGAFHPPLVASVISAIVQFAVGMIGIWIGSRVMAMLAPKFGGQDDKLSATKLFVYSATPSWVAGVLSLVPMLGLLGLLFAIYSLYVMFQGITPMLGVKPESRIIFWLACVVVTFIAMAVIGMVAFMFVPSMMPTI